MTKSKNARGVGWQFWIDRGGTFTDIVARRPDGALSRTSCFRKSALSRRGDRRASGSCSACARRAASRRAHRLGQDGHHGGHQRAARAQGRPHVFVITRASPTRCGSPINTARALRAPHRLALDALREVIEIDERIGADGDLVRRLDAAAAPSALRAAYARGIRACAIVLMHGYRFPAHERPSPRSPRAVASNRSPSPIASAR